MLAHACQPRRVYINLIQIQDGMMTAEKKYDVVVFGGTGYTGEHVVREMFITSDEEGVTWAIAGRSNTKMRSVLEKIANELSIEDFSG